MSGNKIGGEKARATNKAKHGEDFYKLIGAKGGNAYHAKPRGFACDPERARRAGALGGRNSKRGKAGVRKEKVYCKVWGE